MKVGIIGGSGLYAMEGLDVVTSEHVETPFGHPSDCYVCGKLGCHDVYFLPRHGVGHRLMPSEINHRANIYGFKKLGVELVLSVSAVGSLREDFRPRDVVLPDQYYDRTKQSRVHTFFGDGMVAHVGFGEPACPGLRAQLARAGETVLARRGQGEAGPRLHVGGTYVCMEGPAFSTRSESQIYRKLGCDLIGMTSLPEAKLCREAELCYQSISMITDYDCWHPDTSAVTVDMVTAHMQANAVLAQDILREAVTSELHLDAACTCRGALAVSLATDPGRVPEDTREKLSLLLGRYWNV
ncbi:MAG: S-methyl-5'-thioadenosine phosphorylase [Kiritimatiellia bacterium]